MGKPKPLPAVAEVPPEALAEDRRRAEAMVALVKEMTKGEDRRERLLRRARPSDQKTLLTDAQSDDNKGLLQRRD